MDVRCERCQTEYELDDASIPEAGVPVQCTTCGYTFSVKRERDGRTTTARFTPAGGGPHGKAQSASVTREDLPAAPPTATWILETEDGKVHRLRDLTTLQKWVVERRVTAADRLSRDGGGLWRELSQVEELAPFFAVVSEADRAKTKSVAAGAPSSQLPSTPSSPPTAPFAEASRPRGVPPRLPPDAPAQGVRGPGGMSPLEAGSGRERLPPLDDAHDPHARPAPTMPLAFEEAEELLPPRRNRAPLLIVGLLLLGGAAVGGYYAFGGNAAPSKSLAPPKATDPSKPAQLHDTPNAAGPAPAVALNPPGGVSKGPAPAADPGALPSPTSAPAGAPSPGAPPAATTASPSSAAGTPPPAAPSGVPATEVAGTRDDAKATKAPSYERLVAEGDKLLENGQTNRAEKAYVQALALKPDGVGALAGTGYVFLDRGRTQKALDVFQRALALDAGHGPAIFGLAEAYRAQGDVASALNTYKHYLATTPNGADASAARRQVHDLEAAARVGKEPEAP